MAIQREEVGNVVVLKVAERLDVTSAPKLREVIDELYERAGREVVVDMESAEYVSSIGLSALLHSAQVAQSQGGRVVISGMQNAVRGIFDMAGLDRVLTSYPSRSTALASFGWAQPQPATGQVEARTILTLPEEILLLTLSDEGGKFVDLPEHSLEYALAAAVLMDLCLRERIDSDLRRVTVVDSSPLGEPVLDPALLAVQRSRVERGADEWIARLAGEGRRIQECVLDRLVERRILVRRHSLVHWVLGARRYPLIDDREQREVKQRVLGILKGDAVPSPHDVAVIALADACAVFDAVLEMSEMMDLRSRVAEVARMDLLAQAMKRALCEAQASSGPGSTPDSVYA